MIDAVKMAAKVALIAVVTGLIVAAFTGIQIPTLNMPLFVSAIGKGKAIVAYYAGWMLPILELGLVFLALKYIVVPTLYFGFIAIKWILKVNE